MLRANWWFFFSSRIPIRSFVVRIELTLRDEPAKCGYVEDPGHQIVQPDEEAQNTSATPLEQRQAGDCDSDNDCVWLSFTGSYHFSENQWKDGDWTITLRNEKWNDLQVESLTIRLVYK